MENLALYERVREVPSNAKKDIGGGRLKGMTDINPMWRIKKLTEEFGPCGFGWYYKITDKRIDEGGNGEKAAFVDIQLFVKQDKEWSMGIEGTGGSAFIAKEKGGLYTNDECFKMALTDAISVACKALGFGANVYFSKDNTKYNDNKKTTHNNQTDKPKYEDKPDELGDKLSALIIQKGATVKGILDKYKEETKKFASEIKFMTADKKQEFIDRLEKLEDHK